MSEGCGNAPSDVQWTTHYLTDEEMREFSGRIGITPREEPSWGFDDEFGYYCRDEEDEPFIKRLFDPRNDSEWAFVRIYTRLCRKAILKNRSYGDSMLHPLGIYGDGDPLKAIGARIDDKLSRHKNHKGAFGENDTEDLIGYLVGYVIAQEEQDE